MRQILDVVARGTCRDPVHQSSQTEPVATDSRADQTDRIVTESRAEQTENVMTDSRADQTEPIPTNSRADQTECINLSASSSQTNPPANTRQSDTQTDALETLDNGPAGVLAASRVLVEMQNSGETANGPAVQDENSLESVPPTNDTSPKAKYKRPKRAHKR